MTVIHEPSGHDDETPEKTSRRGSFAEYYEHHQSRPPRSQVTEAVEHLRQERGDLSQVSALEIGAGAMVEARYLLEAGVGHVDAYDASTEAEARAISVELQHNDIDRHERFAFHRVHNEELPDHLPSEQYDLIISYLTLQFTHPERFDAAWQALLGSLKPGGILSVQLAGDRHGWADTYHRMTFLTRDRVEELFEGLDEVQIEERDQDDKPLSDGGTTRWHDYWIAARKPLGASEARATPDNQV